MNKSAVVSANTDAITTDAIRIVLTLTKVVFTMQRLLITLVHHAFCRAFHHP